MFKSLIFFSTCRIEIIMFILRTIRKIKLDNVC